MKILNLNFLRIILSGCIFVLTLFFPVWNITDGLSPEFFKSLTITTALIVCFVLLVVLSFSIILGFFTYMLTNPKNFNLRKKSKNKKSNKFNS